MAEFEPACDFVLSHEGGFVSDPDDEGGDTNFGISKRQYPEVDIRHLDVRGARAIYFRDYWQPMGYFDEIKSQKVANKIFDMAVNMGYTEAFKLVQRACQSAGVQVEDDGHFGPKTLEAVNSLSEEVMLAGLRGKCAAFYANLIAIRPSNAKFKDGWMKRAYA